MTAQTNSTKRKSYSQVLEKSLKYIEKRRNGDIKSLRTPWPGLNLVGIAGLEWGSMLTVGARPGAGKTMFVSQILREAHRLNPDQRFNILEFQFEMGDEQYGARQFSAEVAKDYATVLSADRPLDEFIVDMMKQYISHTKQLEKMGMTRGIISESSTAAEIEQEIRLAYAEGGSLPLIVTIDHSWLIKKSGSDKDKFDVLYNTTEMLMKLKNQIPIIVIMITQLNRSIEEASRRTPSSVANYPTASDIFGGDALMQGSDMVIVLSRPFELDIKSYGPYAYEVDEDDVFVHLIKVRNGKKKKNILFMNIDGQNQRMVEVPDFTATRPDGAYTRFSQRTGGGGGGSRAVSAPIGNEL